MSTAIARLTAADFEEAMDVLNFSFGFDHPHNFEALLPVLYHPGAEAMSWNWALREEGSIRAIVGVFPLTWKLGDATLRIAGVGGVCCHPRYRKHGFMGQLMRHCVEAMREEGYPLSWLGGQRQRYGYYGYEKCGIKYQLSLAPNNVRHVFGDGDLGIEFRPLERQDRTHLQGVIGLHDAHPIRGVRPRERFYDMLLSWYHKPHIAISPDSRMIGYVVANGNGDRITEILAVNEGEPELQIAAAWVQQHGEATFDLGPSNRLLPKLAAVCGGMSVHSSGNWQIFDWAAALDALLKAQGTLIPLTDGAVVIEIADYGKVLLEVAGGSARCIRSDAAPALQTDAFTAMRLLFGPLPPATVLALPQAAAALEQWCPLPLFWGRQDGV
ncbi:MAG: GNAT family N-acetyltransferase [Candidatus Latescibacteria bacterium]|nr:GNAT family N-acetyltransferase [Candidatus Latescibacterota bacterium]